MKQRANILQQEIGDIALQCDLLALTAMLEAARSGEAGQGFAARAESLRKLSNDISLNDRKNLGASEEADLLGRIGLRLEQLAREQDGISAIATEISDAARRETGAMQFEDVVSQVVVYSIEQAELLRSLVAQIELRQTMLEAEIVKDRDEVGKMADSFRQALEAPRDEWRQNPVRR